MLTEYEHVIAELDAIIEDPSLPMDIKKQAIKTRFELLMMAEGRLHEVEARKSNKAFMLWIAAAVILAIIFGALVP